MTASTTSNLAAKLRQAIDLQPDERLYAVIDAAQDEGKLAFEIRDRFQVRLRSLFQGEAAQYMTEVAPYFVPVDPDSEFLDLWADHWGTNAGILLTSAADPQKIYRHLREIFVVKDEDGQEHFFRYYDPRVLRVFLPTCQAAEATSFFGVIESAFIEEESPEKLTQYSIFTQTVVRKSILIKT